MHLFKALAEDAQNGLSGLHMRQHNKESSCQTGTCAKILQTFVRPALQLPAFRPHRVLFDGWEQIFKCAIPKQQGTWLLTRICASGSIRSPKGLLPGIPHKLAPFGRAPPDTLSHTRTCHALACEHTHTSIVPCPSSWP
eukprot:355136-Chlamydomonas_euryale.AAC.13